MKDKAQAEVVTVYSVPQGGTLVHEDEMPTLRTFTARITAKQAMIGSGYNSRYPIKRFWLFYHRTPEAAWAAFVEDERDRLATAEAQVEVRHRRLAVAETVVLARKLGA